MLRTLQYDTTHRPQRPCGSIVRTCVLPRLVSLNEPLSTDSSYNVWVLLLWNFPHCYYLVHSGSADTENAASRSLQKPPVPFTIIPNSGNCSGTLVQVELICNSPGGQQVARWEPESGINCLVLVVQVPGYRSLVLGHILIHEFMFRSKMFRFRFMYHAFSCLLCRCWLRKLELRFAEAWHTNQPTNPSWVVASVSPMQRSSQLKLTHHKGKNGRGGGGRPGGLAQVLLSAKILSVLFSPACRLPRSSVPVHPQYV